MTCGIVLDSFKHMKTLSPKNAPPVGEFLVEMEKDKIEQLINFRSDLMEYKEPEERASTVGGQVSHEETLRLIEEKDYRKGIILRCDNEGSMQTFLDMLQKSEHVEIIRKGIGDVTVGDIEDR
eukprot:UN00028